MWGRLIQNGQIPAVRIQLRIGRGGDWRIDLQSLKVESNSYEKEKTKDCASVPIPTQQKPLNKNTNQKQVSKISIENLIEKINSM